MMNLNLLSLVCKNNRRKSRPYKMSDMQITRSGLAPNPLETYSPTNLTMFKNDELVSNGATVTEVLTSKTYDFVGKTVGQSHPMKIYHCTATTIQPPTNIGSTFIGDSNQWNGWIDTQQSWVDNIKTQNNVSITASTSLNSSIYAYLVELDITDLLTQLKVSNAIFKSNLIKGITVDAWAKGSGAGGNGVDMKLWNGSSWSSFGTGTVVANNASTSIQKLTIPNIDASSLQQRVNSSNKVYVLIQSSYASDGTIASSVSLDYISIKLDYAVRTIQSGDYAYVGGDTESFNFDFGLKVANSVAECPMKVYRCESVLAPSDVAWREWTAQSDIDKLKLQDGTVFESNTTISGQTKAYLLELDLTDLCNKYSGGSNSAFKTLLKRINFTIFANGSGSNGGVSNNGVVGKVWIENGSSWNVGVSHSNSTPSNNWSASDLAINQSNLGIYLTSTNKIYILVASQYPSNGTIASSVSLDYVNVKIDLTRIPDVVQPIPVTLPRYWACVVKGFSPNWSSVDTLGDLKSLITLVKGDGTDLNNRYVLYYSTSKQLVIGAWENGSALGSNTSASAVTFSKNQVHSFILENNANKLRLRVLLNNGTSLPVTETTLANNTLTGKFALFTLFYNSSAPTRNSNALAESFHLIDLQAVGKIRYGNEITSNGDFSNGLTNWVISKGANSSVVNGVFTINESSAIDNVVYQIIDCLPNTTYRITGNLSANAKFKVAEQNGNTWIKDNFSTTGSGELTLTTGSTTNKLYVILTNQGVVGTYTWDNVSVRQVLQDGLTDAEAELILRGLSLPSDEELIVNGDFSSGSSGWNTIVGSWNITGGKASITTTSVSDRINRNKIDVIPNSIYRLSADITGGGAVLLNLLGADGVTLVGTSAYVTSSSNITIPSNVFYAQIYMHANNVAVGTQLTFDNISLKYIRPQNPILLPMKNLFDISKVTLHPNAQRVGDSIVLNATVPYHTSYLNIPVLPNNVYTITYTKVGYIDDNNYPFVVPVPYYNNVVMSNSLYSGSLYKSNGTYTHTFTVPINCNVMRINLSNTGTGTFTFSNISLKLKM